MDLELDFLGQVAFVLVSENKIINSNYIVDLIVSTGVIFNMEKFDPKKNFKENNIDSLDLFTILLALEEELNIKFDENEANKIKSIDDILKILNSKNI